jgi:hypothetical protein
LRARNIKPSTFKNDLLATADPLYTVIFAGLWCMADREGRLEHRPMKIHLEINPGRSHESTVASIEWLRVNGFLDCYTAERNHYIQIVNFKKHQTPHVKEAASTIPAPDKSWADTGPALLIPDSGFLDSSDSGLPEVGANAPRRGCRLPEDFSLTADRRAVAEAERIDPERTFAKFRDHWAAASGANARKRDWDAAWRNWCRTEADRGKPGARPAASITDRLTWRPE